MVETQALELFLRRAGLRVLLLSADLPEARFTRALRALEPRATVLCGTQARLDVVGTHLRKLLNGGAGARLYSYRSANLVSGRTGLPSLGTHPSEATATLLDVVASRA